MTKGFVYFVACEDPEYRIANPHMKIGWTTDIEGRLKGIQTGSPVKLVIMGYVKSDDATKLESYFHSIFRNDKKHGEWFDVTAAMITRINCYPVCNNRLHEFFIPSPEESDSIEVKALKAEISELRQVIADKDKFIHERGLEYFVPKPVYHREDKTKREWSKFKRTCIHPLP